MSNERIIDEEYEELFPFEQEYNTWVNSIEKDYQEECEYLASLDITGRTKLTFDQ